MVTRKISVQVLEYETQMIENLLCPDVFHHKHPPYAVNDVFQSAFEWLSLTVGREKWYDRIFAMENTSQRLLTSRLFPVDSPRLIGVLEIVDHVV